VDDSDGADFMGCVAEKEKFEQKNLVQNQGFEDGVDEDGVPLHWESRWNPPNGYKSVDPEEKHFGQLFMEICKKMIRMATRVLVLILSLLN
jgi:hypothetical protein